MTCSARAAVAFVFLALCSGCPPQRVEGTEPGDCADRADNDGDGSFDCDDVSCGGSPDCRVMDAGESDAGSSDDAAAEDASTPEDAGAIDAFSSDAPVLADAATAPCEAALVDETFEATSIGALPAGWSSACVGGSSYRAGAASAARTGTRSLEVDFRGSGGESAFGVPVVWPSGGVVDVSFAFQPMTRDQNIYILAVQGDQRLFNAVPFDRFGNFQETATRYEIGTWYAVRYEIDLDASSYRMLIDGVEIRRGAFERSAIPCTLGGTGSYLSFHGGFVDQKWLGRVDDVRVVARGAGCPPRYALAFDGAGDQIQFPMSLGDPGTRFTFEMWVRPTSATPGSAAGEGASLFVHRADCADFWLEWSGSVERTPSRYRFTVYPAAGCGSQVSAESSFDSSLGAWHHVAGVFDGGDVRVYVDGMLAGSARQSNPISWSTRLLGHWAGRDGSDARGDRSAFIGEIDEIRISRTARYSGASFVPPRHLLSDASTVAAWGLDEGLGTVVGDDSPSAFDGTITGARWVPSSR